MVMGAIPANAGIQTNMLDNVESFQALGLPSAMPDAPLAYQGLRRLLVILPLARSPRVGLAGLYVVGNTSFF